MMSTPVAAWMSVDWTPWASSSVPNRISTMAPMTVRAYPPMPPMSEVPPMTTAAMVWNSSGSPTVPEALPVKPRYRIPVMPAKAPETAKVATHIRSGRTSASSAARGLEPRAKRRRP